MGRELIEHQRLDAICAQVDQATAEVRSAFRLLADAKARLYASLGAYHDSVIPPACNDFDLERQSDTAIKIIERNAWRYVLDQIQVWTILSEKAAKNLRDDLEKGKLPTPTPENVTATLETFMAQAGDLFEQALLEVFDWLRPGRWDTHKTNQMYQVGPKVIINDAVQTYYVSSYYDQRLRALDNVFHHLDGKRPPQYPGTLVTTINDAVRNRGIRECETESFACKWFGNGNLHVTFKRLDLLKELNRRGGDHAHLPGHERSAA
jgi:hypothetical protein